MERLTGIRDIRKTHNCAASLLAPFKNSSIIQSIIIPAARVHEKNRPRRKFNSAARRSTTEGKLDFFPLAVSL